MILRCTRYPQLLIATPYGKLRFVDGVAEATDEQAESVLGLSAERYGITADTTAAATPAPAETGGGGDHVPPPPPEPKAPATAVERPPQGAPKADWVAYADAQDPADHSQLTKEQLIKQYGG